MSKNPYQSLEARAFWKTAVAEPDARLIRDLWRPKYIITPLDKIATAGSCFAQHISKALIKHSFCWLDGEPAPSSLRTDEAIAENYGVFSFRTGNIYTAHALSQWVSWAFELAPVPQEYWQREGRFFDPFRPAITPCGFGSVEEMLASRQLTLDAIRRVLTQANVFVFTLGLTEAWVNSRTGLTYAMCPGTVAGEFDESLHQFVNYSASQTSAELNKSFDIIRSFNPAAKFLLTVSPVPLVATASEHHVLVATILSKSILRCAAGEISASRHDTDYFPSYEIITGSPFKGMFYSTNLRSVTDAGVSFVMNHFMGGLGSDKHATPPASISPSHEKDDAASILAELQDEDAFVNASDVVCEEELLKAFAPKS